MRLKHFTEIKLRGPRVRRSLARVRRSLARVRRSLAKVRRELAKVRRDLANVRRELVNVRRKHANVREILVVRRRERVEVRGQTRCGRLRLPGSCRQGTAERTGRSRQLCLCSKERWGGQSSARRRTPKTSSRR